MVEVAIKSNPKQFAAVERHAVFSMNGPAGNHCCHTCQAHTQESVCFALMNQARNILERASRFHTQGAMPKYSFQCFYVNCLHFVELHPPN